MLTNFVFWCKRAESLHSDIPYETFGLGGGWQVWLSLCLRVWNPDFPFWTIRCYEKEMLSTHEPSFTHASPIRCQEDSSAMSYFVPMVRDSHGKTHSIGACGRIERVYATCPDDTISGLGTASFISSIPMVPWLAIGWKNDTPDLFLPDEASQF